jgi:signal transduction histidine kinase
LPLSPPDPAPALAQQVDRLLKQQAVHRTLQEIFLAFTRRVGATLSLGRSLDSLAAEANALFGTARTAIWLHERRARQLVPAGGSDPAVGRTPMRTDDDGPPARGLRLDGPQLEPAGDTVRLLAPLRGWRRALGTVVIEGMPAGLDEAEYLEAAAEFARQLSGAIENVQLLDEVLQQRRLLEDTFNSLSDLVVVVDTAHRVVQTNEAFATRLGLPRQSLLLQPLAALLGPEIAGWIGEPGAAQDTARSRQVTDDRLEGIFTATVTPLINQEGAPTGQVLVARDITAQTRLEREQAALHERLAQSEKLASLGQFIAGIAHEMNNPLQGVLGHLELLMTTSEAARPIRRTLRQIYREGDRAAKIVRNLLVFAGSRRMIPRPLRLERVVARAVRSRIAARRRARITLVRRISRDLPPITGDALLLQQALLNVLINAEHAVAAEQAVAAADTDPRRRIEIVASAAGDDIVRMTIRDSGRGIPADVLPRIFDPFFTTKEVGEGTGLGLALTYGIIQEHGGTIQAANAPEGGALFTIELPAAPGTQ